jgi:hypothetical protein|tara:strand:- start:547 stop:759 length:213 start_codon:yes stop_codon:yes gene_type:complete
MSKKVIYERFNAITGKWEQEVTTEAEFLREMTELSKETDILNAELEIANKIIEQYLNKPIGNTKLEESKD